MLMFVPERKRNRNAHTYIVKFAKTIIRRMYKNLKTLLFIWVGAKNKNWSKYSWNSVLSLYLQMVLAFQVIEYFIYLKRTKSK